MCSVFFFQESLSTAEVTAICDIPARLFANINPNTAGNNSSNISSELQQLGASLDPKTASKILFAFSPRVSYLINCNDKQWTGIK